MGEAKEINLLFTVEGHRRRGRRKKIVMEARDGTGKGSYNISIRTEVNKEHCDKL